MDEDGSGPIRDEVAAERMEELTESGENSGDVGVFDVSPGQQDTSHKLAESETRGLRKNPRQVKAGRVRVACKCGAALVFGWRTFHVFRG